MDGARSNLAEVFSTIRRIGDMPANADFSATNAELDAGYGRLSAAGLEGRALVREEVRLELAKAERNDFFLLDLGHFLVGEDCADIAVSTDALRTLDPNDPIVQVGHQNLFEFAHALARRGDPSLEGALDRVVLGPEGDVFVVQHALQVDQTLQGVFIYGAYSPASDLHLVDLLSTQTPQRLRILEILTWLGSPMSAEMLRSKIATIALEPSPEAFLRAATVVLRFGGADGRRTLVALSPRSTDARVTQLMTSAREDLASTSYETLRAKFGSRADPVAPDVLRERMRQMIANRGIDDGFNPALILDSEIPRDELIGWLQAIRSARLHSVSDEALSEVQLTNALISVLVFRPR